MNFARFIFHLGLGTLLLLLFAGCGPVQYDTIGTERATGADAHIELEELDGGNVMVTIEATNLPPPERVSPGASHYIAWFVPPGGEAIRAGALEYDEDDREGTLTATSPNGEFEIRVTAEHSDVVNEPSDNVVISQRADIED